MENMNHVARQDRAIQHPDADVLERKSFVTSLAKSLVQTQWNAERTHASYRATGFVVGLTGEWGLGKTSVLNLLAADLRSMDNVVVAALNPWLFKGRDELVHAYFNSLRDALGQSPGEKARKLQGQLERYKNALEATGSAAAALVDVYVGGTVATAVWKKWIAKGLKILLKPKELSANEERKSLEKKLLDENIAVVVLIDELDRVEDEEVRAVAQLVKAVGDIKGISYLVAYDPERVTQALGRGSCPEERQRSGESYLEKIIQFSIPLRPLFKDDARALLLAALGHNGVALSEPTQPHETEIIAQLLNAVRTPREIKRLIGAFSVLEEMLRDELCPYDLLAYCWLVAKSSSLRQMIADNLQRLVDDPDIEEWTQRMSSDSSGRATRLTVVEVLGSAAIPHQALLILMFPRFRTDRQRLESIADGNRMAKRRNLVRLLYLGNPPGAFSRKDIEALWSVEDPAALADRLRLLVQEDRIDALLDRVGDLLPMLPRASDCTFWIGLSRALTRCHDWIRNQESASRLVDDASTLLWRMATAVPNGRHHVKNVVDALAHEGDLLITPWILRKHLFAHELTPYPRQTNGDEIYTLSETLLLQQQELPRYRAAVNDGTMLRRLPDTEALYCIINSNQWDDEMRTALTRQLDDWDAVSTFAALIVPPGVRTTRANLREMVEIEVVLSVINRLITQARPMTSEWVMSSVDRLIATLQDRDPDFPDELAR